MKIDRATVAHIAALAQLELSEPEMQAMERDLANILQYVAQLDRLDLTGVAAMAQVAPAGAGGESGRGDAPQPSFSQEQALGNAPASGGGCFKLPRVIAPTP